MLAKIKFCNNFEHAIHIALAYEASKGWVSAAGPALGRTHASKTQITRNSPRSSTTPRPTPSTREDGKKTTWSWGNERAFSVTNKPFKFEDAEVKAKGARFAEFSGPVKINRPSTAVTLTFVENKTTVSIPKE